MSTHTDASPVDRPPLNEPPKTVAWKGFAAGTISGLTKLAVGHPFDTIKIRMQVSPPNTYAGPLDCLRRTIRLEGLRALYKGASPPAFGWAMSDSILLGSLHNYRLKIAKWESRQRGESTMDSSTKPLSLAGHTLAGVLAGWTVCFMITPIEHIKAKLQMQTTGPKLYTGPIDCARQVYRAGGIPGLWHGLGATLLFRTNMGIMYGSYEGFLRINRSFADDAPYKLNDSTAIFVAGGLGANAFWLTAFPADCVKNRLMADSPTNPRYPTWNSAARQIWSEGGVRALYRGFVPAFLRAFPTNASALLVWETTMRVLGAEKLSTGEKNKD